MPAKNKRSRVQSARRARERGEDPVAAAARELHAREAELEAEAALRACSPYMRDFMTGHERFDVEGAVTVDELTALTTSELTCTELSDLDSAS